MRGILAAAASVLALAGLVYVLKSPDTPFLRPVPGAVWVRCARPVNLQVWAPGEIFAYFRRRVTVSAVPGGAALTVYAMRDSAVRWDGKILLGPSGDLRSWKKPRRAELPPAVKPGDHELLVTVMNRDGPAVVAVDCPALGAVFREREKPVLRLAAGCAALYFAALAALYLKAPIYSTAKASYLSGLTPCFAVLAAAGLKPVLRRPTGRAAAFGLLACWALAAYGAYFIL